jgi:UDPglucose 6-dehydrogenase
MKISIVGTGYVGLSNAVLFAKDFQTVALDIDEDKVDLINNKKSPIIDNLLQDALSNNDLNLTATLSKEEAYKDANYIIIATPTDFNDETNYFDTSSIESVLNDVEKINPEGICIIKSTVPIGYTKKLKSKFKIKEIIFCPEFLREGSAFYDVQNPSRIVIGSNSRAAIEFTEILKSLSHKNHVKVFFMSSDESESIKLFSNSFLAMRVAFFNELDNYCIENNLSSKDIIRGMSEDPRIGNFYNNPSFGYGGYCLPKDTKQLKSNFRTIENSLISSIVSSNEVRKNFIANYVINQRIKNLGVYKLAMKTNSDNFRSSSVLDVIEIISKNSDINIFIYDDSINEDYFMRYRVEKSFNRFKDKSDIILANRCSNELNDVSEKVLSRDIFNTN